MSLTSASASRTSSSTSRSSSANPFAQAAQAPAPTRPADPAPRRSTQQEQQPTASGCRTATVAGVKRTNPFDQPAGSKLSKSSRVRERSTLLQDAGRRSNSPDKLYNSSVGFSPTSTATLSASAAAKGKGRESSASTLAVDLSGASHNELLRNLMSTKENALTHRSATDAPVDIVVTATSGHQVANYGPGRSRVDNYFAERNRKLKEQAAAKVDDVFRGVLVWCDGLVSVGDGPGATSDLEIKRLVNLHGGAVANAPGQRVTHIISATALTAKKTAALLGKTRGWRPAVVRPGWVLESVRLGKRAAVGAWSILHANEGQSTLGQEFSRSSPAVPSRRAAATASVPSLTASRAVSAPPLASPSCSATAVTAANKPVKAPPIVLVLDSDDEDA